ncbi:Protein kinase domain-containing protein [Aphelenchoides besseyi]|nr:Protein kinase domain-containing protein [Aphelenchoides besseyi]
MKKGTWGERKSQKKKLKKKEVELNLEDKKKVKDRKKPSGNQKKSSDKKTKARKRPSAQRYKKCQPLEYVEVKDPSIKFLAQQKPVRGYQLRPEQFTHKGAAVIPRFMNVDISKPPEKSDKTVEDSNVQLTFDDQLNEVYDIGSEVEIVTNERRPRRNVSALQPTHATVTNNNLNPLENDAKSTPRSEQRSQSNGFYDDPARFNEIRGRQSRRRDSPAKSDQLQLIEYTDRLPNVGDVIFSETNRSYTLSEVIGSGGYGTVFKANRDMRSVALKAEKMSKTLLKVEIAVLKTANQRRCKHFCQLFDFGRTSKDFFFIVLTLLGPDLAKLRNAMLNRRFSLSTAVRVAMQTSSAIEELHTMGFGELKNISRDVKPANYAIGNKNDKLHRIVYMFDFGLARQYVDKASNPNNSILLICFL